ncbi:sensor histidine kinase [Marinobacter sp. S0848L]|uniref:sensor histidine kinase n=1 Tax=Marinobacter sp. S0848L TaxID=2926423 RepID=UPI001FF1A295|nr:sensor histidine kinase [Marinobacter sp. S0848L]MCK0105800.1 sensor histidine kinase [Marinobacter sp. S0848L]
MKTLNLGTRVVLITGLSIIFSVFLILFVAYGRLLHDFEEVLSERQALQADSMASRVNEELSIRLNALSAFASTLTDGEDLLPMDQLKFAMARQPGLENLFQDDLLIFDNNGVAITENRFVPNRIGTSYADRPHFKRAMAANTPIVSRPIIGRRTGLPLLSFLAPIRSDDGDLLGLAGGTINLTQKGILPDDLNPEPGTLLKVLDTGHFIQVDALQPGTPAPDLPPPGEDMLIDAALSGVNAGVVSDGSGEDWVYATQHLDRLGWLFLSAAPYALATQPAKAWFKSFLWASVAVMVPLLFFAYLMTRAATHSLSSMSEKIHEMTTGNARNTRLSITGTTETRNLANAFNALMDEREALDALKSQFVSNVSHELRTPLTSINGSMKLLDSGATGQLPDKASALIKVALRNGEHLQALITDLLDFDKAVSGKLSIHTTTTRIDEAIHQACEGNQAMANQYGVRLTSKHAEGLAACADPERLRQILNNFISNAIKYSPRDGLITVEAEATQTGYIRITVSDEGDGVPEHFTPNLFQRFAQAEVGSSRAKSGTGLGLAICKELAELMNGKVGYFYNHGAHFWLELPTSPCTQGSLHENT